MANWDKKGAKDAPPYPPPAPTPTTFPSSIMSAVEGLQVVAAWPPCRAPKATGEGAVFIFDTPASGGVCLAIVW